MSRCRCGAMAHEDGIFARLLSRVDMLLNCPSCTISYQIPDDAVGPSGRKVKCHKCGHVWHAMPREEAEPAPAADAGQALAATPDDDGWNGESGRVADAPGAQEELDELRGLLDGTGLEKTVGAEAGKGEDAAPARRRARLPGMAGMAGVRGVRGTGLSAPRMMVIAALAGLVAGGALWLRHDIVEALPGTARLYAAAGLPVNLRGLEFHNVGFETVIENGLPVLAVRGEVVNVTEQPVDIPDISYSLRNHRMQEIYAWTGKPSRRAVAPAERASFATRLLAPPVDAEQVQIRFVAGAGRS